MTQAQQLIDEYARIGNKDMQIGLLVDLYERISQTLAYLRLELGNAKDSHIVAYCARKRGRTLKMLEFAKGMNKEGKKLVLNKLELKADWATVDQLVDEMKKEAEVERTHQTCLALEKILKAIEMRVNWYKHESKETKQNNSTI